MSDSDAINNELYLSIYFFILHGVTKLSCCSILLPKLVRCSFLVTKFVISRLPSYSIALLCNFVNVHYNILSKLSCCTCTHLSLYLLRYTSAQPSSTIRSIIVYICSEIAKSRVVSLITTVHYSSCKRMNAPIFICQSLKPVALATSEGRSAQHAAHVCQSRRPVCLRCRFRDFPRSSRPTGVV